MCAISSKLWQLVSSRSVWLAQHTAGTYPAGEALDRHKMSILLLVGHRPGKQLSKHSLLVSLQALKDFRDRISKYEEVYETITDRNSHYIKLIDMRVPAPSHCKHSMFNFGRWAGSEGYPSLTTRAAGHSSHAGRLLASQLRSE